MERKMRKLVNGQVVNVDNIELFEKGFEGLVLNKKASSSIKDTARSDNVFINDCIEYYNKFMGSLPFPLFAIESNCKYAFIANYIKDNVLGLDINDIYVDNCINIRLEDDNKTLKLVYKTWAIESIREKSDTAMSIDLAQFEDETEYKDFKWCYDHIKSGEGTSKYYMTFMRDFIVACQQEMMLKWELNNILKFGYFPDELKLSDNRILDKDKGYEYLIDVYCTGRKKSNDSVLEIVIGDTTKVEQKQKMYKVYDFDTYRKKLTDSANPDNTDNKNNKLEKIDKESMCAIFKYILTTGVEEEAIKSVKYRGFIVNGKMIFEIDNKVYMCGSESLTKTSLIASNSSIYAYENGKLYIKNEKKLPSGVIKSNIYSYDFSNGAGRLCNTRFYI